MQFREIYRIYKTKNNREIPLLDASYTRLARRLDAIFLFDRFSDDAQAVLLWVE
jgi:hypothetical protein